MNTLPRCLLALLLVVVYVECCTSKATAQDSAATNPDAPFSEKALERFKAGEVREDFLVPTSPAFAVLGVTPEQVIRPDTPKALGAALLNGVDPDGNLQSGIAIDFSPYYLFAGRYLTLKQYRNSLPTRVASRLQVSLATTKGSNDDKALRLATGFRVALWDKADPRMSPFLDTCYDGAGLKELEKGRNEKASFLAALGAIHFSIEERTKQIIKEKEQGHTDEVRALEAEVEKLRAQEPALSEKRDVTAQKVATLQAQAKEVLAKIWSDCNKEFEKMYWNATNFTVGAAPIFISKDGNVGDLTGSGGAVYGTFAYGFEGIPRLEHTSQVILHARYRTKEQLADPKMAGSFIKQDVVLLGAQLRIAGPDFGNKVGGRDLAFFGEFDYSILNRYGMKDDNLYRYAIGAEYKLMDNVTLSLTVGDESGDNRRTAGAFTLGNLKWSF